MYAPVTPRFRMVAPVRPLTITPYSPDCVFGPGGSSTVAFESLPINAIVSRVTVTTDVSEPALKVSILL